MNIKSLILFLPLLQVLAFGAEESRITAMSFNTWGRLSQVDDGFRKGTDAIRKSGVDIVGFQESSPEVAERMAGELGWHFAEGGSGSAQILSRFPVARSFTAEGIENGRFLGARIRLSEDPLREVVFCTLHLDHTHYGPYAAIAEGATEGKTLAENGLSKRGPQIVAVLAAMQPFLAEADVTPVFLTGDFNVPSHLDWTESIKGKGLGVKWPESVLVAESGLIDSFRLANPDVAKQAGTTWSTIHKESEPQDRIDFMYHKGVNVGVEDSRVFATAVEKTIGPWGSNKKEVEANTWPSDHAAVVTGYQIRWAR